MTKHLLVEAIEAEEVGLKVCRKHKQEFSEPVVYDALRCPLCELLREMSKPSRARRELES